MEILRELPNDLKWNVLKYLQHPTAEIMREEIDDYDIAKGLDTLRDGVEYYEFALHDSHNRYCRGCGEWVAECMCDAANYCDCCAELWDDCTCFFGRCGDYYSLCRNECVTNDG